jgi:VWA domain-containing protein
MAAIAFVLVFSPVATRAQTLPGAQASRDRQPRDTDMVLIPVVATTASGAYVPDLRKEEFSVLEDGVKQQLTFFAAAKAPFHIVLMLDTSTRSDEKQSEKMEQIQNAAIAFVDQLPAGDSVKVISFDDEVRDLNAFSNDKVVLRASIQRTQPGTNTKLYDAMQTALEALLPLGGSRAIVLLTDGVDWHSDRARFEDALWVLDESGIVVYPIRYETRAETEKSLRQSTGPELPTIDIVRRNPGGTTPPTFPGGDPLPIPRRPGDSQIPGDVSRLPPPSVIFPRRRPDVPDPGTSRPGGDRIPDVRNTPHGDPNIPGDPTPPSKSKTTPGDSVTRRLDGLYLTADRYLNGLAARSGGRLTRANTLAALPDAFRIINTELHTQYLLGYYPTNSARDGSYRKVEASTTRKEVVARAKPGYRAPSGN